MRSTRTYIALALVYLLIPGTFEATENLVHLVAHGDMAHSADHSAHHEPDAEHDCSGLFHSCLCHSSVLVTIAMSGSTLAVPPPRAGSHLIRNLDRSTSGYPDRLYRPPIA
jgi:hypothetical protein